MDLLKAQGAYLAHGPAVGEMALPEVTAAKRHPGGESPWHPVDYLRQVEAMADGASEQIYQQPENYDLEHSKPEPDIGFFCRLARRSKPSRILELACGNGRIIVPLAAEAHQWGAQVVGLDSSSEMIAAGREKNSTSNITWVQGDMLDWRDENGFDLIICPCSSLSHLLPLEDHLSAWRTAFQNLKPNGSFVVAEQMANLPTIAESSAIPPRVLLEIDNDTERRASNGKPLERLVRYRATRYFAHEQRANVRFLYEDAKRAWSR